jgi:ABC-2 type transport system ATP-binding protein
MSHNALKISNLTKKYDNGTEALKGVSLDVPAGDFFALLGPNGAGKTTIIGIMTQLVSKTSGSVSIFGHDIEKEPEKAKTYIGLVGQEVNFNPFEKPLDIVVNQAGYYGVPRSVALPRATQILTDLGLGDKIDVQARTLSGGMKRRLMIARALIHQPKFLILDEPTAGVDVELRRGMWDYLHGLVKGGLTILLTTHYLEEAEQLAKHVAIIRKGEIVHNGKMDELLAKHPGKKLEDIYLELTRAHE